ncbi:hypothetical protein [Leifsonia sp. 21MFCrub1.1]|uniref:hypothetical protein n=1 Tax=Leifsonia sp. 21MFCrub1.1 TaxID=1798223 RepID=UPI00089290F2|nr:hypothetical protein [Leifsonia sp. 21MFCrub1.1]SEA68086.1 hypothetical protein SAMN04515680_1159 [Leifsonia sp. 21MFCrub1.1]
MVRVAEHPRNARTVRLRKHKLGDVVPLLWGGQPFTGEVVRVRELPKGHRLYTIELKLADGNVEEPILAVLDDRELATLTPTVTS